MIFLGLCEAVLFSIAIIMIDMTHNIRGHAKDTLKDVKGGKALYQFCWVIGALYVVHGMIFLTFYFFYFSFVILVYMFLKFNNSFQVKDEERGLTIVEKMVTRRGTGEIVKTSKIVTLQKQDIPLFIQESMSQ